MKKEIKDLVKFAESLGYEFVRITNDGHYLYQHKVTGKRHGLPGSPRGGRRTIENCRAELRKKARPDAQ